MTNQPSTINPSIIIAAITEHAANQLPRSAVGWDGRTLLTPAERRFYGLRLVVKYQGWIDQAGYPRSRA